MNLLVSVLLDFALEDAGSRRLVESGGLQDMCRIDPIVAAAAHNLYSVSISIRFRLEAGLTMLLQTFTKLELVDRDLQDISYTFCDVALKLH